ncbi:SDR family NAD(P)-dependent oxidoreductase [Nonomuraea sp. B10E15]|uniref:SDR family oxidoreductase n=1 Tax=Nonomuraea sp. B10E15 TaxID=3153560 RepID=UPI00325F78A4
MNFTQPGADLVCLNAGIVGQDLGAPWEVSDDDWDRVFAVNVGGVRNGLRAFVPGLLAAGRPAHILVTASLAGLVTFPGGGAYAASKHAVVALAEQASLALEGTPVGVTLLCPALAVNAVGVAPIRSVPDSPSRIRDRSCRGASGRLRLTGARRLVRGRVRCRGRGSRPIPGRHVGGLAATDRGL